MAEQVATQLIVFGRGLEIDAQGIRLTAAARARVDAAIGYIASHVNPFQEKPGTIVFSGGYAGASEGVRPPSEEFREGNLMLKRASTARIHNRPLPDFASLRAEILSDSTLESVLQVYEHNYFDGARFSVANPLGLVAHQAHMPRIDFLVRKVFDLERSAVCRIFASGKDHQASGISESALYALTRFMCFGARRPQALRRRERLLEFGAVSLRNIRSQLHKAA